MNCPRCYTVNEPEARFCRNCGADLMGTPSTANSASNKDLTYVLFAFAWGYFVIIVWFIVQRLVAPGMIRAGKQTTLYGIYNIMGWTGDILSIIVMLVFAILVNNKTAKIFLIAFMVVHIITLIGYRVFKMGL